MHWIRKSARTICWGVLGLIAAMALMFIFGDDSLNEGNSALAALMVVLALTGLIWVPFVLFVSIVSLWSDYVATGSVKSWVRSPALGVCIIMLYLLSLILI